MNSTAIKLLNSKKALLFVVAGSLGGLISGWLTGFFDLDEAAFTSWVFAGALDAALIGALIVCAQTYYQTKILLSFDKLKQSIKVGGVLGGLGGIIALLSISYLVEGDIGRIIGWAISGGVAGYVVSRQVPNLAKKHAVIAGAIGAAVGCMIMYIELGYTTGVVVTGAAIGFVVASAEELMRKSWVEVTEYSDVFKDAGINLSKINNRYTLTLGNDPIRIGYSSGMHVLLKGSGMSLEKEVCTLTVESNKFYMNDFKSGKRTELFQGTPVKIQNCELKIGCSE